MKRGEYGMRFFKKAHHHETRGSQIVEAKAYQTIMIAEVLGYK